MNVDTWAFIQLQGADPLSNSNFSAHSSDSSILWCWRQGCLTSSSPAVLINILFSIDMYAFIAQIIKDFEIDHSSGFVCPDCLRVFLCCSFNRGQSLTDLRKVRIFLWFVSLRWSRGQKRGCWSHRTVRQPEGLFMTPASAVRPGAVFPSWESPGQLHQLPEF